MKPWIILLLAALALVPAAQADERPDHYEGRQAASLEEALRLFSESNARLTEMLQREDLSLNDLASVHELSYTMENALQKINAEVAQMAIELEAVHLASEQADFDTVREQGRAYLERAQKLVP